MLCGGRGPPLDSATKVMLLQYRTGLSDEQAMGRPGICSGRSRLGLPVDHRGWNSSSLTRFQARLLLQGNKERLALENTVALAEELGLLDRPTEQIVDSTPMLGAAATQDNVRLVRSGVKEVLDAVAGSDEEAAKALDRGLEFEYAKAAEKPDCRWRERSERERMLTRVAEDAERALRAVERADCCWRGRGEGGSRSPARVGQDFDVDEDGVPRLHRGTRQDRITHLAYTDTDKRVRRRDRLGGLIHEYRMAA
jgi:hypothetical protein